MIDFYKNLLDTAEKKGKDYVVDVQKMFEGLEKSGLHHEKIGVSHIFSRHKLTEEQREEIRKRDEKIIKAGTEAYTAAVNRQIIESMREEGLL